MPGYDLTELLAREELRLIAGLAAEAGVEAFLVGGCIRDHLLERATRDLDFALTGAVEELPRAFAERVSGRFFWLDEGRGQSRVVLKRIGGNAIYDFAPLAGQSIEDDLRHRDFTINAMAMPLESQNANLIDPLQCRADLYRRVIRKCSQSAFDDDPLRLMRAIRFSAELAFSIEEKTWNDLCGKAPLLNSAASERIRDELFRILAAPSCAVYLLKLVESGLWREISPQIEMVHPGGAPIVEEVDRLYLKHGLAKHLDREIESRVTIISLIKLVAFLGRLEKMRSDKLAARLRLGRETGRILGLLSCGGGRIYESLERSGTERTMFRFFRDREPAGIAIIIVARASGKITGTAFERLLGYYTKIYDPGAGDLFLSGGEVMEMLGIPPGKAVGRALGKLREAEANGTVSNREEARGYIKNLLTNEEAMG
jgi:poly(A) polymerase